MPWKTFLAAHWDGLAAADSFTVEVLTMFGLERYTVLFVMRLKTRTVEIAGITSQPDGTWMTQVARNLTDANDGFLRGVHSLILGRDPLYTTGLRDLLRSSGVKPLLLPARSPNLNAYAERFVESVRIECLNRIVPAARRICGPSSERLSIIIMRNGRTRVWPTSLSRPRPPRPAQVCRKRLGGVLRFYYRAAA